MGAWETDLIGNDDVQDFFIDISNLIKVKDFAYMVSANDFKEDVKELIIGNRAAILKISEDCSESILSFIGVLKILKIDLLESELKSFNNALESEYQNIKVWSEPDLRKSYLKALELSVEENTSYNFSMKI